MKLGFLLIAVLVLGSCTTLPQTHPLPPINAALVIKKCDDQALNVYPVAIKIIPKGVPINTVICKLTDIIRCDESPLQTVVEFDSNDRLRKQLFSDCVQAKLNPHI